MKSSLRNPADASFRKASPSDVECLTQLCRQPFARSLRWAPGGAFARKWWRAAIASTYAEVWVYVVEDEIGGAAVLVFDEPGWNRERKVRCGSRRDYALAMLNAPGLILHEFGRRIRLRLAARRATVGTNPHPLSGSRSWMEMLVVSPSFQGQGVATRLKTYCEERSLALGRKVLESSVDPKNLRMRRLNEKLGYTHTRQTRAGCIYTKEL